VAISSTILALKAQKRQEKLDTYQFALEQINLDMERKYKTQKES